jgi:serine/threonine protein kinase
VELQLNELLNRLEQIGSYRILEKLLSSFVCHTYLAKHKRTEDLVELKIYDLSVLPDKRDKDGLLKIAKRESETLRKLSATKGIIRIAKTFQPVKEYGGELYYFALNIPEGPCLASRMPDKSWTLLSRLIAAKELCQIIHSIHEAGMIHCNLKPSCIYFTRDQSSFQLTGFEFFRLLRSTINIKSNGLVASPYTSPEVMLSPYNANKASDVYSMAVIIFEMLSGRRPFGNRTRLREDICPGLGLAKRLLPLKKRADLDVILDDLLTYTPKRRLSNLYDIIDFVDELTEELKNTTVR